MVSFMLQLFHSSRVSSLDYESMLFITFYLQLNMCLLSDSFFFDSSDVAENLIMQSRSFFFFFLFHFLLRKFMNFLFHFFISPSYLTISLQLRTPTLRLRFNSLFRIVSTRVDRSMIKTELKSLLELTA